MMRELNLNGLKTDLKKEGIRNFLRDLFIYDGVEAIQYFTEDTFILQKN